MIHDPGPSSECPTSSRRRYRSCVKRPRPEESVDVLHIVPAYYPSRGGIEVLLEGLTEALYDGFGLASAIAAPALPGQSPGVGEHRGVRVYRITSAPETVIASEAVETRRLQPSEAFALLRDVYVSVRRILQDLSPRLVHVHGTSLMAPAASAVATSVRIPVLFHVHGNINDDIESPRLRDRLREAPWVCSVSDAVADSIVRDCGRRAPVRIVRNGVGDPRPSTRPTRQHSPSVAMVGRLSPEKGFDDGLRALRNVWSRLPDLKIRIVGAGPEEDSLHSLVLALGMTDVVEYFGQLSHADTLRVIAGSDVVLVPSTRIEGFSLVAVEAAYLERPVVATSVGGLPETVRDGVTGILVGPGDLPAMADAVLRLLTQPGLGHDLGLAARERALREFTLERCASDVAHLYSDIWTSSGPAHVCEE